MTNRWEDAEALLVACADDDLRAEGAVQPAMVAFAGAALRFVAWVRPFPKGEYVKPLTELFALAAPLDCDRLMLSVAGRAWSLDDPIPPVAGDVDMRQRLLLLYVVDGTGGDLESTSVAYPFELGPDGPAWQERRVLGRAEGWIPGAMEVMVRSRDRMRAPLADIAAQAARVARLGHDLHLPPDLMALLAAHATVDG